MNRHIEQIRRRLAEQRRLAHHNQAHNQLTGETATIEQVVIKIRAPKIDSAAVLNSAMN